MDNSYTNVRLKINMRDFHKKARCYADNVKAYDTIVRLNGDFFTMDSRPYENLCNEYGIFYTKTFKE